MTSSRRHLWTQKILSSLDDFFVLLVFVNRSNLNSILTYKLNININIIFFLDKKFWTNMSLFCQYLRVWNLDNAKRRRWDAVFIQIELDYQYTRWSSLLFIILIKKITSVRGSNSSDVVHRAFLFFFSFFLLEIFLLTYIFSFFFFFFFLPTILFFVIVTWTQHKEVQKQQHHYSEIDNTSSSRSIVDTTTYFFPSSVHSRKKHMRNEFYMCNNKCSSFSRNHALRSFDLQFDN